MSATSRPALVVPARFTRTEYATVALNGHPRRDWLALQATMATCGSGLRLDHRAVLSLIVDLRDSGWRVRHDSVDGAIGLVPPKELARESRRRILGRWRTKNPPESASWLRDRTADLRVQLARGKDLRPELIDPTVEPCVCEHDHEVFRFFNATWSAPQGRYVGRRIRFLVRDQGHPCKPLIGLLSIGSSIVRSKERDDYIGWSAEQRRLNLINVMDISVLGALPPYNWLLGGKLMCYVAASDQIRRYYASRYSKQRTLQMGRVSSDLALLMTSSLFGRSSIYNRVRHAGGDLFQEIGYSGGFGTLHLSRTTVDLLKQLLQRYQSVPANRFGDGPNWKMRLIRTACDLLGLDSQLVLNHGLRKSLYAVHTAHNSLEYLRGEDDRLRYKGRPLKGIVEHWRNRWLAPRIQRSEVWENVLAFEPDLWDPFA